VNNGDMPHNTGVIYTIDTFFCEAALLSDEFSVIYYKQTVCSA